jgi:hypothetical protein
MDLIPFTFIKQLPVLLIGIAEPYFLNRLIVDITDYAATEGIPAAKDGFAVGHEEHFTFDFWAGSPETIRLSAPGPVVQRGNGGLISVLTPEVNKILLFITGYIQIDHPDFHVAFAAQPVSFFNETEHVIHNFPEIAPTAAFFKGLLGKSVNAEPDPVDSGCQGSFHIEFGMKVTV